MTERGQRYDGAHEQLTKKLNETVRIFALENGHRVPTPADLRQMDRSLDHVADQLLWFGCDVWPEGYDDEGDGGEPTPDLSPSFNFDHMVEPNAGTAFMTAYRRMFTPISAACALVLALVLAPIEMSGASQSANSLTPRILNSASSQLSTPTQMMDGFSLDQGA